MKISTTLDVPARRMGLVPSLKILKKVGFDCLDYGRTCSGYEFQKGLFSLPDASFAALFAEDYKAIAEEGLFVGQVHAPFPTYQDRPEEFSYMVAAIRRSLYAAQLLHSPYLVLHCAMPCGWTSDDNPDRTREMNYRIFELLLPTAQQCGVKLALENMPGQKIPTCSPEALIDYIDMMRSEWLVACLDTGHAHMTGISPADFARQLGSRLQVLHVHDNNAKSDQHYTPYLGSIDWHDFSMALQEIHYSGTFSLESDRIPENFPCALYEKTAELEYLTAEHIVNLARKP